MFGLEDQYSVVRAMLTRRFLARCSLSLLALPGLAAADQIHRFTFELESAANAPASQAGTGSR